MNTHIKNKGLTYLYNCFHSQKAPSPIPAFLEMNGKGARSSAPFFFPFSALISSPVLSSRSSWGGIPRRQWRWFLMPKGSTMIFIK